MRGDQLSNLLAGQVGVVSGVLTPNEVREWLDYEPYNGGDEFYLGLQGSPVNEANPIGTDKGSPYDQMGKEEER